MICIYAKTGIDPGGRTQPVAGKKALSYFAYIHSRHAGYPASGTEARHISVTEHGRIL